MELFLAGGRWEMRGRGDVLVLVLLGSGACSWYICAFNLVLLY